MISASLKCIPNGSVVTSSEQLEVERDTTSRGPLEREGPGSRRRGTSRGPRAAIHHVVVLSQIRPRPVTSFFEAIDQDEGRGACSMSSGIET